MTPTETTRETTAVVVVTYNRADLLAAMLEGLAALDPAPELVVVIDNASTDHTPDVLAACTLPGLQVVRTPGEPRRRRAASTSAPARRTTPASTGSG